MIITANSLFWIDFFFFMVLKWSPMTVGFSPMQMNSHRIELTIEFRNGNRKVLLELELSDYTFLT